MTGNRPYDNSASQAERLAAHRNDERVRKGGTYCEIAASEAGAVGGRYAAQSRSTVIGSSPVHYPALPSSSPWAHDSVPAEPSLGVPIDAMEPVGTHSEIQNSLAESPGGEGIKSPTSPPNDRPGGAGAPVRHSTHCRQRRRRSPNANA